MNKTIAIIQARMGSQRLPGKVLMPLGSTQVLRWVYSACVRASGINDIWIATTLSEKDNEIQEWCGRLHIKCYRGSEDDVLSRFVECAVVAGNPDVILRLTGDCPFIDPRVISEVIELRKRTNAAYASNVDPRTYPDGLDVECFTREALEVAHLEATDPIDRDTVTYWIRRNRSRFPAANLTCPIPGMQNERWVLDTQKDYEFCQEIAKYMPGSMTDILSILEVRPELRNINNPTGTNPGMNERFYDALAMEKVKPRSYHRSQQLLARAETIIPLGAQTFSKSKLQFPQPAASFLSHGDGCLVWDCDGNEYVDCMSALLPVVLGYRDPDVDNAIRRQLDSGISFSLATEIEHELASLLVKHIPCAEMVRFGKTGTDATTCAVRLARAFTGREQILICGGYHGWGSWSCDRAAGITDAERADSVRVPFGEHEMPIWVEDYAAVIVEPETNPEYLKFLREWCNTNGALLIFDEIITGFRYSLGGAQKLFGVTPDLACFGKSMANGMPISAVCGRRDIMMKMVPPNNIFYSGTFFGETLSIAAAIAAINKMGRENVIQKLENIGLHLAIGINRLLLKYGLDEHIWLSGHASFKRVKFKDERVGAMFRKEMMSSGTLIIASNNVMMALDSKAQKRVLRSYDWTFDKIKTAIEKGELEETKVSEGVRI